MTTDPKPPFSGPADALTQAQVFYGAFKYALDELRESVAEHQPSREAVDDALSHMEDIETCLRDVRPDDDDDEPVEGRR